MFKKSFGKKVLEKLSLSVLVLGCVVVLCQASLVSAGPMTTELTCKDFGTVAGSKVIMIVDVGGVSAKGEIPKDGTISLDATLKIPDGCLGYDNNVPGAVNYDAFFRLEFALETPSGIKTIISQPDYNTRDISKGLTTYTFKLPWQVSGLTAKNANRPVQVGDQVSIFAYLLEQRVGSANYAKVYFNNSPLIVVEGSSVVLPGGGADTDPGSKSGGSNQISTPVVGTIDSPISIKSLGELITTGIKYLLGFLATLSVLFIIIGGVRMVVSGGSEGEVKAGKQTVTWAVVGMVVSLLAFTIINVVQSLLKVK